MGIANSSKLRGVVLSVLITLLTPLSSSARQITLSNAVTQQQAALIGRDVSIDLTLPDDADTKQAMAIPDLSNQSLKQWLSERVGYIIGEKEGDKNSLLKGQQYDYPNAGVFPAFEAPDRNVPRPEMAGERNGKKVVTVMSNVGTTFYYMGKNSGFELGYKFSSKRGDQVIPITSPRVGIIKVGMGLFGIMPYQANPNSIANTWFRLSTFFHEAHHSDGNGTSLGMPHAVCPKGHLYFNYNACDREANGPYAVESYLIKMARIKCVANRSCNAGEAEAMAHMALDARSRILATNFIDPRPEGVATGAVSAN